MFATRLDSWLHKKAADDLFARWSGVTLSCLGPSSVLIEVGWFSDVRYHSYPR